MPKINLRLKHLSQEHRAAMLLAHAARDIMPQSAGDLPAFAKKLCEIFETEMEPHFQEEERHAVPQLRNLGHDDWADRTIKEHSEMRAMVVELLREATVDKIRAFSAAMQAHVEFEENIVWEVLEDAFKPHPQATVA